MEKWKQFKEQWVLFDRKTKLMAIGTIGIVLLSFILAVGNFTTRLGQWDNGEESAYSSSEEGIPIASEESMLATTLVDLLANQEHHGIAADNELVAIAFDKEGFTEYNGDIETYVQVKFLTIEATDNGRSGTWRVKYPGGITQDHPFSFIEDSERGVYIMESSAFPTCQLFETAALGSLVF